MSSPMESPAAAAADGAAPVATLSASASAPGAASPAKKGRGAGRRLTDRERLEILNEFERTPGVSNADVARRYGITRAAVQKLKAKGPEVKARYRFGSVGLRDGRKRGSHSVSVPFERELFEWVRGLKARKVPVPPSLVKEKAKLLVPKYNLGSFQASNGWYYNFCKRFSIATGVQPEDRAEAAAQAAALEQQQLLDQQRRQQQLLEQQEELRRRLLNPPVLTDVEDHSPSTMATTPVALTPPSAAAVVQPEVLSESAKSDRILALLEAQAGLIERQTRASEQQAETLKKLLDLLVASRSNATSI